MPLIFTLTNASSGFFITSWMGCLPQAQMAAEFAASVFERETAKVPVLVSYDNHIYLLFAHRLEQQILCCLTVVEIYLYYLQCHFLSRC